MPIRLGAYLLSLVSFCWMSLYRMLSCWALLFSVYWFSWVSLCLCRNAECRYVCWMLFFNKCHNAGFHFINWDDALFGLNAILLSVHLLNVNNMSVIFQNAIILCVILLNAFAQSVLAPLLMPHSQTLDLVGNVTLFVVNYFGKKLYGIVHRWRDNEN